MLDAEIPLEADPPVTRDGWRRRAVMWFGHAIRHWVSSHIARHSQVGDPAVFATEQFPWVRVLEGNWRAILAEAEAITRVPDEVPSLITISPDHEGIADWRWKSFFLWGYGYRIDENCARCPTTARLLQAVPGLETAFFSIMEPGAHLTPHEGVTKAIFTCHLGLRVPREAEKCWMRVDGQKLVWREGKALVFDDTYEHEVLNATPEPRVVLLLHVRRPLRFPGSLIAAGFLAAVRLSPFIQDPLKNLAAWNARFRRRGPVES